MNAADVLAELRREGIELACREGRLCARPSLRSRPALLTLVRDHAAELRRVLDAGEPHQDDDDADREAWEERAAIMEYDGGMTRAEAERAATECLRRDASKRTVPAALDWGDLRPCAWCRNLARSGRCLAAARGELRASRDYEPTFPGQPQRCIGYDPKDDDPDRTRGRERWPELVAWQARLNNDGKPEGRGHG